MLRARSTLAALLLVSGAIAAACGSDKSTTEVVPPVPNIDTIAFASSLGINLASFTKTSYGLYIKDVTVGTGATVATGDSVFVHYFGYLPNGVLFDSRPATAAPYGIKVGAGRVIAGWDSGTVGMKVGGTRQLIIPPSLGYGATANGSIPANSVLVFTITAVSKK
jgi:FKBP-type peptidyl-prolyl cis-trans isomerase FkpA